MYRKFRTSCQQEMEAGFPNHSAVTFYYSTVHRSLQDNHSDNVSAPLQRRAQHILPYTMTYNRRGGELIFYGAPLVYHSSTFATGRGRRFIVQYIKVQSSRSSITFDPLITLTLKLGVFGASMQSIDASGTKRRCAIRPRTVFSSIRQEYLCWSICCMDLCCPTDIPKRFVTPQTLLLPQRQRDNDRSPVEDGQL